MPTHRKSYTAIRVWATLCVIPNIVVAQAVDASNPNFWPVYHDPKFAFRISYPADWISAPARSSNVRFSVSPPSGSGNCNVVAKADSELARLSQTALNVEVRAMGIDAASWSEYVGIPAAHVRLLNARRAAVQAIPALVGVFETDLENLQGRYVRRQIVAMTMTPQAVYTINCGISVATSSLAAAKFAQMAPMFEKVVGSFTFAP